MAYPRPTSTQLLTNAVNYIISQNLGGDGQTPANISILRILAQLISQMVYSCYGYIDYVSLQSVPFTCTGEYIEAWANLKGITRNLATDSTGVVSFTGTTGANVPSGTTLTTNDGTLFTTDAAFIIGTTSTVNITANVAGSAGNYPSGTTIKIQTAISGVSATTLTGAITGGTDNETDASLQSRMLEAYAAQPTGGSQADYVKWALSCPGVTRAWASNAPPVDSEVVIWVMFDTTESAYGGFPQGSNGGATSDIRTTTATGDQLAVANTIFPLRPVTAIPYVAAPVAYPINITIQALATNSAATQAAIATAISNMLYTRGSPLGMTLYQSDIVGAIASAADVTQYILQSFTDLVIAQNYIPTLGTVTYT